MTKKERRERDNFRQALSMSFANTSDVALLERDYESEYFDMRDYVRTTERERMSAE
jgi:rRNA processing protein Krr1/Pno1